MEYAKASVGLEGIYLSDELLELSDNYIAGYLTPDEYKKVFFEIVDR
ncbi:antitoxin VbhA family protein [Pasteurella atlantica]|uniref:Antitoxin VbhA family protein n=2 Tax=Pasteurellaceae TaxID=712 RepID=A0ACC6HND9_9PAST|nr:antitoxin VbhA family protein [Pasteurella atlantica]MDP8033484.1 antitoxin VbhA family protein [Pasteurella atlantica]MDP8035420.1 antitoxin VbhA family protein [Pasteurella atlantica]MDP8037371.1 antitoxin VbhA family protein [Pasteurella atlantica]MDP8047719.1 antitoxin VbhA family protein [Pasteurella atlantica]MDP8049720.1 antitoxin VbhA family protein [Pasteurella atlantica]